MLQTRSTSADLIKGIAVVLMVQVHLLELFAHSDISTSPIGYWLMFLGGPPVAPVFATIMGYYAASSNKSTTELIWRGCKLFLLGMILNVCLNLNLITQVYNAKINFDLKPYLFGVDILHLAGLSIIIIALLKKILWRYKWISALLIGLVIVASNYPLALPENMTGKYLLSYISGCSNWSYFPLIPWLVYPLSGLLFFKLEENIKPDFRLHPYAKLAAIISLFLYVYFTRSYAVHTSTNLPAYYHHDALFCLWTLAFIALYMITVKEIKGLFPKFFVLRYLEWLGKNVTIVFVIQWILIGNIATNIYKSISNPIIFALCFVGILACSSLLTFLYLKLANALKSK